MKKFIFCFFLFFTFFVFSSDIVLARIGVGVNTGKIQVKEKLQAGMIYELPPITVINTGDEPGDYETTVSYHQDQTELRPKKDWFIFSPQKFHLDPDKAQIVEVKINLPLTIEPGDYFAYLEAHPLKNVQKGATSLGVAAASKLYFTVTPANILYGIYYKITSFWNIYSPWPQRLVVLAGLVAAVFFFKRFFNIQINFKKTETKLNSEIKHFKKIKILEPDEIRKKDE